MNHRTDWRWDSADCNLQGAQRAIPRTHSRHGTEIPGVPVCRIPHVSQGGLRGVRRLGHGRVRSGTQRPDLKSSQRALAQGLGLALAFLEARDPPSRKTGRAGPTNTLSRPGYRPHIRKLLSKGPSPLRTTLHQLLVLPQEPGVVTFPRSPFAVSHAPADVFAFLSELGLFQVRKGPGSLRPSCAVRTDQPHSWWKPVSPGSEGLGNIQEG